MSDALRCLHYERGEKEALLEKNSALEMQIVGYKSTIAALEKETELLAETASVLTAQRDRADVSAELLNDQLNDTEAKIAMRDERLKQQAEAALLLRHYVVALEAQVEADDKHELEQLHDIAELCKERALLRTQIAALQAVVEQVEWVWMDDEDGNFYNVCAWCYQGGEQASHASDCPRQVALGLTKGGKGE